MAKSECVNGLALLEPLARREHEIIEAVRDERRAGGKADGLRAIDKLLLVRRADEFAGVGRFCPCAFVVAMQRAGERDQRAARDRTRHVQEHRNRGRSDLVRGNVAGRRGRMLREKVTERWHGRRGNGLMVIWRFFWPSAGRDYRVRRNAAETRHRGGRDG
jgi:hypothetical protein